MLANCPECGALAVMFADYEQNTTEGLGLRCAKRCGWKRSFSDLEDWAFKAIEDNRRLWEALESIKTIANTPPQSVADKSIIDIICTALDAKEPDAQAT